MKTISKIIFSILVSLFSVETLFAATETLESGITKRNSVKQYHFKYYKIEPNGHSNLNVVLDNLSADLDLYVRKDAIPQFGSNVSNQCRSWQGGTHQETCNLNVSGASIVYVNVYGYKAGSFNLKATLSGGNSTPAPSLKLIRSGRAVNDYVAYQQWSHFKMPANGNTRVKVELDNLSDDLDLYVRKNAQPIHGSVSGQCRPYNNGTLKEECNQSISANDTVYISVYGYRAGSFKLTATLSRAPTNNTPSSGTTERLGYPFSNNERWTVCQGYNTNPLTHHPAGPGYGITVGADLSLSWDLMDYPYSASGTYGCGFPSYGYSNGREIIAPASGVITRFTYAGDLACINFDNNTLGSMLIGHFGQHGGSRVVVGQRVTKGVTVLGTLHQNAASGGGFAHIHMGLYSDSNCFSPKPFGTHFNDGRNYFNSNTPYQWYGTVLHRGSN